MSSVIRENGEKDLFAEVALAADELYSIRETFFPVNPDEKTSLLQSKSDLALQLLDAIPPENTRVGNVNGTVPNLGRM
nr:tetratricopeptide repeat protein 5-like isoform X1 [Ipomoea batatas]